MPHHPRRGLTLVEMLVAMTASLILFGAVVTVFQILGDAVSRSRRTGRLDSDMCSLRLQLQQDLAGVTANKDTNGLLCEVDSGSVTGYFEVIEGPNNDLIDYSVNPLYDRSTNAARAGTGSNDASSNDRLVGDTDDMLFFTTRSVVAEPFTGKAGTTAVTANQAEVAYFCRPTPNTASPTLYTLHRRQLVITGGTTTWAFTNWDNFYTMYDVSARRGDLNGVPTIIPNNANDLQHRRNRFGHDLAVSATNQNLAIFRLPVTAADLRLKGVRTDEDVIATNVLAFDVRLLDPLAVERQGAGTARLQPGDDEYRSSANVATSSAVYGDLGFNAFVDFPGGTAAPGVFSGFGRPGHVLSGTSTAARTYDTWTSFYRTNGQDDDDRNGIDDDGERPPYAEQLRGIQVVIRLYDVDTRTIKQATITRSFRK